MAHSTEIRAKDVVNVVDGRKLGTVMDIEFTPDGQIASFSLPAPFSFKDLVRGERAGLVIPWKRVVLLGQDVILVHLEASELRQMRE